MARAAAAPPASHLEEAPSAVEFVEVEAARCGKASHQLCCPVGINGSVPLSCD